MVEIAHVYANEQDPAMFLVGDTLVVFHFGARNPDDPHDPGEVGSPGPGGAPSPAPVHPVGVMSAADKADLTTKASKWTVITTPRYMARRQFESLDGLIADFGSSDSEQVVVVPPHGPQRLDEILSKTARVTGVHEVHVDLFHPSRE